MAARGWDGYDILLVSGDAYVDHPSFGAAVIGRVLEADGFRVAILAQPDWRGPGAFAAMGRPRLAAMVTSGNVDSMVSHYTAAKKTRSEDLYAPGGRAGLRPDRAVLVYAQRLREAFPGLPLVLGGLEASLRRFAHYDYWEDKVRRSALLDARADLLVYGMGERASRDIARGLASGVMARDLIDIRGTCYISSENMFPVNPRDTVVCPSFEDVSTDKTAYARAAISQYEEQDAVRGRRIVQPHGGRWLVQNPPAPPLTTEELDAAAELPYTLDPHPMYDEAGGVPAIEEVRFSLIHNRGCFGGCSFCALTLHQGRAVSVRSQESLLREAERLIARPDFKGYIHDVGGPTANFRHPSCARQKTHGLCRGKNCLTPEPCRHLDADHTDFIVLLRRLRALPGVKKVFVRSGLRYDYLLLDPSGEALPELVRHHISGQLKVAPEHCVDSVLDCMGKPRFAVYQRFCERYAKLNKRYGKQQFLVPYLISSHPGCTLKDAVALAECLRDMGRQPEQVQDFYPTPGALSTCMYYTGLDPRTMKPVYVAKTPREKAMQRALLQFRRPDKRRLVREALAEAGRADLIGYGKRALVPPEGRRPGAGPPGPNPNPGRHRK
jgi:uncharacterized radical SAM protein YgiQ